MTARTTRSGAGIAAILFGSVITVAGCANQSKPANLGAIGCEQPCCANCRNACSVPPGTNAALDTASQDALRAALQDERNAQAFYANVIARHGDVRPFINIVRAEGRHEAMVLAVMERHGVTDPKLAPGPLPDVAPTVAACAALAAKLERENIALYDRLIPTIHEPDVRTVFERLRAASLDNHLPAFERFAG